VDVVKIIVDRELCEGNARCVGVAPTVFQMDDDEKLVLLIESPPPELHEAVETAAALCPRGALKLVES
jgi:ferredoxin